MLAGAFASPRPQGPPVAEPYKLEKAENGALSVVAASGKRRKLKRWESGGAHDWSIFQDAYGSWHCWSPYYVNVLPTIDLHSFVNFVDVASSGATAESEYSAHETSESAGGAIDDDASTLSFGDVAGVVDVVGSDVEGSNVAAGVVAAGVVVGSDVEGSVVAAILDENAISVGVVVGSDVKDSVVAAIVAPGISDVNAISVGEHAMASGSDVEAAAIVVANEVTSGSSPDAVPVAVPMKATPKAKGKAYEGSLGGIKATPKMFSKKTEDK
jgi:hypothetical protein